MFQTNPLDKQFYAVKKFYLQIPSAGRASLGQLLPASQFINGLEALYATAEDWQAGHIILAEFGYLNTSVSLLRELAASLLGHRVPIAILYADGSYFLGVD